MPEGRVNSRFLGLMVVVLVCVAQSVVLAQNYLVTCQNLHDYTVRLATGTPATTPTPIVTPPSSPQARGSKCVSCIATNTDSGAAYAIQLYDYDGTNNNLMGTVNVPLSSGNTTAAPTVNLFSSASVTGLPLDGGSGGNPYIEIAAGHKLAVASTTAVTAAKNVDITCTCCDF